MIANRLRELRKSKRLTQQQVADKIGLTRPAYTAYETGKRVPDGPMTAKLATIYDVTTDYILERTNSTSDDSNYSYEKINGVNSKNKLIENMGEITSFDETDIIKIPIVGTIKCGPNGLALSDHTGYGLVQKSEIGDPHDYFWLRTKGDSMIGDGIFDGDTALIKKDVDIENGKIYAVIIDGEEGTLKHVTKNKDSIVLTASNSKYQPRVFVGSDMNEIFIAGRLVQIKRNF